MYMLVFWDLIPVYAVHGYQCKVDSGFTVNKSLEEWKQQNPGVAETLTPIKHVEWEYEGNITRVPLNQRFVCQTTREKVWHIVQRKDEKIIDSEAGEVLAEYVDYYTSQPTLALLSGGSLSDLKFWLEINSCERGMWPKKQISFNGFYTDVKKLGRVE